MPPLVTGTKLIDSVQLPPGASVVQGAPASAYSRGRIAVSAKFLVVRLLIVN